MMFKTILSVVIATGFYFYEKPVTENVPGITDPRPVEMAADTTKKDAETGLLVDENLYMVKAQCISCHSSKLILQHRFTRDGWKQKIRWMQKNHNLWELGDTEKQVLDYLEKNYNPTATVARRAPLKDIKWYKLEQH